MIIVIERLNQQLYVDGFFQVDLKGKILIIGVSWRVGDLYNEEFLIIRIVLIWSEIFYEIINIKGYFIRNVIKWFYEWVYIFIFIVIYY